MTLLETPRLPLRMLRENDFQDQTDMIADPEAMRYLPLGEPLPRPEAWCNMAAVLGHWQLRGFRSWEVEEKSNAELIGGVGPFCPTGWPGLELIRTIRRQSWGKGLPPGAPASRWHISSTTGQAITWSV